MWRNIGRVLTVSALVLTTAPSSATAAESGIDVAAVDRLVSDFAGKAGYEGVAVAITQGDRVLHVAGDGSDSAGAPVTGQTRMPIASVSKPFTALAVMQLVEAGKVSLDGPVRDYLPGFRIADPRGSAITVRQLLDQTSGITDSTLREKSLDQPDSLAGAVTRAQEATLATQPGSEHSYSNTNFHLAARLVETVSGEPFAHYLRDHVFLPAGMRSTTSITTTPQDLPDDVADGYTYAYGFPLPAEEPDRFVAGSDGVITNAADLARWLIVQRGGGVAANGNRLVSADAVDAMHRPSEPRGHYGLGWETGPDGRVGHGGVWYTFTAGTSLPSSGYGVAVLTNSGFTLGNEGTRALEDDIAELLAGGRPSTGFPTRLAVDLVLAALTVLAGTLGVLGTRRARRWAERGRHRAAWHNALRLLPRLVPIAVLVLLPWLLGSFLWGGRDITSWQLGYYSPPLVLGVAVAALANAAVLAGRVTWLVRLRGSAPASA